VAFATFEVPDTLQSVVFVSWSEGANLTVTFASIDGVIPPPRGQLAAGFRRLADSIEASEPGSQRGT
jgi:hypothetical protein